MRVRPLLVILGIATLGLLAFGVAEATEDGSGTGPSVHAQSSTVGRAATSPSPHRSRLVDRTIRIGRSAEGRPIRATEVGDPTSSDSVLVVGCIHGDECAGIPVAQD